MANSPTAPVPPRRSLPEIGDEVHDTRSNYPGNVTDIYRGDLVLRPVHGSGPTWNVPEKEAASQLTITARREEREA